MVQGFNQTIEVEATTENQNVEQENQPTDQVIEQEPQPTQQPNQQPQFNPVEKIREWCWLCRERFGSFPNSEEIAEAWRRLTGQQLTPEGLQVLIEKLNLNLED